MKGNSAIFAPLRFNWGTIGVQEPPKLPASGEGESQTVRAPIFNAETRRTQRRDAVVGTSPIFASLRFNWGAIGVQEPPKLPESTEGESQAVRASVFNAETRRTQRRAAAFGISILSDLFRIWWQSARTFGFRISHPRPLPFVLQAILVLPLTCAAQLELLPPPEPPQLFGGRTRTLSLTWHNPGNETLRQPLSMRLCQASSATVIPLDTTPWKTLEMLPGQTVIESAQVTFPEVKAETRFVIQWLAGTNQVLATTDARVYPTNLLQELKTLAGDDPLGILDPQNQIKPLLKAAAIEFTDFEDANVENYSGKLVIAGPFQNKAQMREGLASRLQTLAGKGVGVVWLQPPPEPKDPPKPSFFTVLEGKGAVVVAQGSLVAQLADRPQSQLNLVHFARLALHPEPVGLPYLIPQP
jgi:hypothetical protein